MQARILRGSREIGGNCIELAFAGQRIVLDLGRPLWAEPGEHVPLPPVPGLAEGNNPSLRGVVISHPHLDHCGLLEEVPRGVPVFVGEAAHRILSTAAEYSRMFRRFQPGGFLRHRRTFELGPFRLTPYLNDHSAFDAYSLLVEAGGRRLFYTGDFRATGRKAGLFRQLLRQPPRGVHTLLMEGTHVPSRGKPSGDRVSTEAETEQACVRTMKATSGLVLAIYSAQNIDRLVTLYRAARKSGRQLVVDPYTAEIAAATGLKSIPQPGFSGLRVFVPQYQRLRALRSRKFSRVDAFRRWRIYPEEVRRLKDRLVFSFRGSMIRDLDSQDLLEGASAIWSLWRGYLDMESSRPIREFLDRHGVELKVHHASGHAGIRDLQRLEKALAPERVVPIHTMGADRFQEVLPQVAQHEDGEWWEV